MLLQKRIYLNGNTIGLTVSFIDSRSTLKDSFAQYESEIVNK